MTTSASSAKAFSELGSIARRDAGRTCLRSTQRRRRDGFHGMSISHYRDWPGLGAYERLIRAKITVRSPVPGAGRIITIILIREKSIIKIAQGHQNFKYVK